MSTNLKRDAMSNKMNLGINTVYVDVDKIGALGLRRAEMCLGRWGTYEERVDKLLSDIRASEANRLPYSIHLPVFLGSWFEYDYLDAFYLDADEEKRELSFRLLEENLENLKAFSPEYYVLHFPGVYLSEGYQDQFEDFESVLKVALDRIDDMAKRYGVKVLLEYFGSNRRFSDYRKWITWIEKYASLGILTDTGHLYFSSLIHQFDFMEALKVLGEKSDAFHLWTTKGNQPYGRSEYYKQFHHIMPHESQLRKDGWAFDVPSVIRLISSYQKPMIIEASMGYGGESYFYEGIESIKSIVGGDL